MRSRRWVCLAPTLLIFCACTRETSSAHPTTSLPASSTFATSAAPEPTGVPGLTASDPMCAAWAGYVGTIQALGVAASFGDLSSQQIAGLELTSAPYLAEVVGVIGESWPAELESERTTVIEQRIGPYTRRAGRAVETLVDSGVTAAELSELRSAWRSALATRDPQSPVLAVPTVSAHVQAKLDAAATVYDSALTPFAQDPSLVVDSVDAPLTDAYLLAHCPDLAASGVGDAL